MEGSYQQMEPAAAAAIGIIYFIIMAIGYIETIVVVYPDAHSVREYNNRYYSLDGDR
jgi:LPS O-antigen subunit length determinant protein (WzzB/FepE family)